MAHIRNVPWLSHCSSSEPTATAGQNHGVFCSFRILSFIRSSGVVASESYPGSF